ncbi:MAG: hypothetical protein WBL62_06795 [Gallionella sp.]
MRCTCPACGSSFSLDALLGNEGARDAVMAALAFPAPLGQQMIRYLALFRPAQRSISLDRIANLINELLPMIQAAAITRNGRIYNAPQDYWRMAMDDMVGKRGTGSLTLPLKSHGYLLAIIEGYNLKAEQRQETAVEARRGGVMPSTAVPAAQQPHPLLAAPRKPRSEIPDHLKSKPKLNDTT